MTNAAGSVVTGATRYYKAGGHVVASRDGLGHLSWLISDQQGTAMASVDQATLAVLLRRQDPFGNARGSAPNWPNPHGFVGGTVEPTGLVHLGARMYDPTIGRFTTKDPVVDTGNPQQMNGYSYAANNPTSDSDPSGQWSVHDQVVIQTAIEATGYLNGLGVTGLALPDIGRTGEETNRILGGAFGKNGATDGFADVVFIGKGIIYVWGNWSGRAIRPDGPLIRFATCGNVEGQREVVQDELSTCYRS